MWTTLHNFVLSITTELAIAQNIPRSVIDIFLLVPFVALLLAFLRHFVGLKTIGLFFPIVLSVIFAVSGFTYGLIMILFVALFTIFGRVLVRPLRLLYLPRSAFIITVVTMGMFWTLIFIAAAYQRNPVESMSILSFVVLLMFTEDFLRVQNDKGARNALLLMSETVLIAVVGGLLLRWQSARDAVYTYPELVLLVPLLALVLNSWTGLRLAELYRFRLLAKKLRVGSGK